MLYTIKSDSLTVKIDSLGAELTSVVGDNGFEYIWQSPSEDFWSGHSPVLFPHCGRILNSEYSYGGKVYKMGAHGFAKSKEFAVASHTESSLTLTLSTSVETKEIYPFDFNITAEFKIDKSRLNVNFTVQNCGNSTLPYMFGWHPALTLDAAKDAGVEDFKLCFDGADTVRWHKVLPGGFVAPVGLDYQLQDSCYRLCEEEIYSNDTMIFVGTNDAVKLVSDLSSRSVEMSWSKNLPYFCIWKHPDSNARFICLEPWSDIPSEGLEAENFETKKMTRLEAGNSETYTYSVKFL